MELQGRREAVREQGLGLAALSYDPPATLKAFAEQRGITFPLLSDPGSAIIRQYGLLNATVARGTRTYGIPHPGTFILDKDGVVVARFFESAYQDRVTVSSIVVKLQQQEPTTAISGVQLTTRHVDVTTYVSDETVAPGTTFSIVADFVVKPRMHVYAPNQQRYIPVAIKVSPSPLLKLRAMKYPKPEIYHFKPLDERVNVFQKPFRLVYDISLVVNQDTRALAKKPDATFTIAGTIEYQACDDAVCYPPETLPVSWTVKLKPLES